MIWTAGLVVNNSIIWNGEREPDSMLTWTTAFSKILPFSKLQVVPPPVEFLERWFQLLRLNVTLVSVSSIKRIMSFCIEYNKKKKIKNKNKIK